MTDTTKRVGVEEWIAVLRRDAELSRGGLAYLDVVANELAALLLRASDLTADRDSWRRLAERLEVEKLDAQAKLAEREAEVEALRSSVAAMDSVQDDALERATDRLIESTLENSAQAMTALRKRAEAAERARDEACGLLREVLERDEAPLNGRCHCINHSRKAEREYEAGSCPHQRSAAFLAANGERNG